MGLENTVNDKIRCTAGRIVAGIHEASDQNTRRLVEFLPKRGQLRGVWTNQRAMRLRPRQAKNETHDE